MKMGKKLLAGLLAAVMWLSLSGCNGENGAVQDRAEDGPVQSAAAPDLLNFWSESGSFSIRVPDVAGGWTQADGGNAEHLVLDNPDQSFSILVQGLPKDAEQFGDLDSLMEFYREQALSSYGDPTSENVTVGEGLTAKAESYSTTEDGVTAKALVVFIEGANGYYVYTVTGLAEQYDAGIDAQREAIANFTESVD